MLFSSSIFLFFFLPLIILGYYLFPKSLRTYFLMCASLFFYAWGEPRYILIMLLSIVVNYTFGLLFTVLNKNIRKFLLFLAIVSNLSILIYFKYLMFMLSMVNDIFHSNFDVPNIVMPIGISFFTFQGMSYVIDVYKEKIKVQKNFAFLTFYISFFPQLIAGPIVRYIDIEKYIYQRTETLEKFIVGIKRFVIGLAKKMLIANTVGFVADQIFAHPAVENTVAMAWLGIICYTFQIFFDFSGYSDMAIGLGKMFGFDFSENFNYPYISVTITEFWHRWHISLSTWFRDYLYIPIGGSKSGNVYANITTVFAITGFWHGASVNFIVWGLIYGICLIIERICNVREVKKKRWMPLRWTLTMLIVIVGWVFFRIERLSEAFRYLGIMFGIVQPENVGVTTIGYYLDVKVVIALAIAVIASIPVFQIRLLKKLRKSKVWNYVSAVSVLLLFFISIIFVMASSYNPFIYFRF